LPFAIDLHDFLAIPLEPGVAEGVFGLSDRHDLPTQAQYRPIIEDAEFRQFRASPGTVTSRRGAQRQQLADVDQQ
jgi:hypothetical protein